MQAHNILRQEFGGRDITAKFQHLLTKEYQGYEFLTSTSYFETIQHLKEECSFIIKNPKQKEKHEKCNV
eukprot:UN32815